LKKHESDGPTILDDSSVSPNCPQGSDKESPFFDIRNFMGKLLSHKVHHNQLSVDVDEEEDEEDIEDPEEEEIDDEVSDLDVEEDSPDSGR